MNYSYIIIDDDQESVLKTKAMADSFRAYFIASANNYEEGLNLILEHTPQLIFSRLTLQIKSKLSLMLINELHRYLKVIPKLLLLLPKDFMKQSNMGLQIIF
jgi:two-component SAPR family response regulator